MKIVIDFNNVKECEYLKAILEDLGVAYYDMVKTLKFEIVSFGCTFKEYDIAIKGELISIDKEDVENIVVYNED